MARSTPAATKAAYSFGSNESFHFNSTADAYGLKGVGMISGAQYTSNDVSIEDVNLGPSQTFDVIDRVILNAQGRSTTSTHSTI
jgi:hypothetical protein